jgi:hypothetical protein
LNSTVYYYSIVPVNGNGSALGCATNSFTTEAVPANVILMQNGSVTSCDASFYDSGNSNGNYSNDETLSLTISPATANSVVKVVFNSFATETDLDQLNVYNGSDANGTLLQTLTGSLTGPIEFTSTAVGGALTFVFNSDFQVSDAGWDASISCVQLPDAPSCAVIASPSDASTDVAIDASISWTAGTGGTPDSYDVYFGTASNSLVLVSDNQVGTSYSPSGLLNNTTYFWSVISTNTGGVSADCPVYSFTTEVAIPQVPSCVVVSSPLDNATDVALSSSLSWTAGLTGGTPDSYDVYFGNDANSLTLVSAGQTETTYSPVGLLNNTTYYWSVTATNAGGSSSQCAVSSFTTIAITPEAPSCAVIASPADAATDVALDASISWTAGTGGTPDSYDVYFGTAADALVLVSNDQTSTSYSLSGLANSTTYYWSVTSTNTGGSSSECNVYSFTTTSIVPQAPSCVVVASPSDASIDVATNASISWTPGSGGTPDSYDVYFGTDANALVLVSEGQTSTTYSPSSLLLNTTYYWSIVATNVGGSSADCGVYSFTTITETPVAPECVAVGSPADASTDIALSTTLTWTAGNGGAPDSYDVYFGTAANALVLVSEGQTSTSYSPVGLLNNTTYFWSVTATNSAGSSTNCSVQSFTTIAVANPDTVIMQNGAVTTCNGFFYDSGSISADYQVDEDYTLTISPSTPGSLLQVDFSAFNIEADYDFLSIYNGNSTAAPLINTYTGTNGPGIVVSSATDGSLTFNFTSDVSVTELGWEAAITCIDPNAAPSCATSFAPANASTDNSIATTLSWSNGGGLVTGYNVYFGTAADALVLVSSDQAGTTYNPGALELNTTYFWQVVPVNGSNAAVGCSVQSFTTEAIANIVMQNNSLTVCNANFFDSGDLASNYQSDENYTLTLTPATAGNVLEVIFSSFNTEDTYDSLYVYNGNSTAAPLIGAFTGLVSPGSILSTAADGSLTFVFTSDISVTRAGWSASVTCIDPEALANCATNLQPANAATEVSATGTSISWTSGGGGVTGYDVYFGTDASSLALVSPNQVETSFNLDGLDLNTTYYWQIVPINANGSTSDCAVNSFTTSSIIDVVMSTATITTCSANFYDSGAIGNNYASDENSTITFLPSTPNNAIQVTFNAFDLEQSTFSGTIYDSLIVYNGPDATFPVIGVYSGTTIPGPFVSSDPSGALTFHFSSDVSVTRAGWDADVVCISTLDVPSCVTSVSPSDQSVDALITSQLSWTAPTGVVTGYDVYFGTAIDALVLVSDNQTGTTYDPGTLDVNTTYFWQVVPVNDAGVAVDCNVNSFTTSPSADIVIFNGEITICDANLFDTGGSTGDYQLNEEYTLTIYPSTPGALVQLDFTSFDVEDGWDFLDIYDGNSATGTPAVSLTGNVLPAQFISTATDGSVTLQFTSDGSTNAPGFEIAISCFVAQTAPECVTNPSPVDAEPAAPLNASISWTAANGFPTGYDVYFGTAADALVLVSSGQVGTSYTPAGLTAGTTYYWQVIPVNDIGSATGCQVYSFTTGQEENINMFSGTVTTCLANFYDSQGATANYLLNENNTLVVNPATPNNVMRVTFNSFASETTWDQLLIYSGQTTAGPLLATLTGAALTMPVTYTSTDLTGALTFVFTSDVSITNAGWDADLVCVSTTEIPGCVVNPSPADASTEISATSTNLSWGIGTGIAFTYDVYFGTDPSSLALVSQGQAGTSFNPGQLDLNTTYYWQVVPANASGAAEGCAVYSFTTSSSIDIIMSNATITTCNAHFYDSGNITGNYVNNENYTLTILPDQAGNSIQINFTAFNIENNWDFLRIYNGNSVAAPLIATFTGNTPAQQIPTAPITSSAVDGSLTIVFTSDGSINRPGWSADVTCIDATTVPECAVMVSGPIDGATDVCLNDAVFNWTTGAGAPATSYDVYVDFGGGLTLVSDDQTTTSFDLGVLEANTSYVVQIIPSNANGEAVGCPTITFTTGTCLNYCDASATNCDEYIANVEMANINNPTDCTAGGYNDYTSISADVYVGTATPLTITNGVLDYTQDQCGVWIDWNHDGDFADANETIAITGTPGTGPYTAQVIPPVDAYIGTTTMRVRITFTGAVNPCGNATWGEVEDYSINVFAPLACPFPNNITSSEATTTTSVITWDAVTDALEYQVRYRLVSEPTTVATWATPLIVPSPLSFTFLENLVACEDYVLQIGSVCEAGVEPVFSSNLNFGTRCIECTADLTPEGEDCGLDLNGGCNSGVFGTIACGETICGTSFYDGTNRDTDWFQFDVTSDGVYTVNVLAEFDGTIFFADATDCNNVITPSQGNFVAGEAFTLATSLTVGTYSIILVPSFDQVPFTCTDFNAYTLGLSSGVTQIAPVADVCETTASFNLFAIPAGGVWSGTGITDATAGTFDPSVTGVGSFDVVYQAVGTGCASSDTVTINVGAAPVVDFVGLAANYCSTVDEVVLTGIPAGGIFAITPSVPGAIAGNVFYPNAVSAGSYDITYTVSLGSNSCAGSITQTVTVTDGPVVSIDGLASAVCSQDAPIALAGTPSTGTFSGNGVVGSSFDPTLSGVGPQTITYTVTEAGNVCPGIATAVIQVNPAPVVAISGVSGDYCLNSSVVTMIGTPALGTFSIDGNPSGSTFDPATAGIGTHTLRYEFNNGTCIGFDEVTVNVVDNLNVAITNLPAAICSKDNAILLTSTPEGAVFSGPGVIGGNTFDPSQVTVGLHTITATYTNGNCSAVATQQIVVNPEPVASFNYSANGATVVFNNSSINASSYSWNFGDNSAVSTAVNPTHTYSTNGAYTIELTATSADCGSSTYSVQLELSVGIGSIDGVDMIQLYPNPTSGNVMLAFNSLNQQSFEVRITDATGRLIETDALTNYMGKFNKMYDLSDKAKGVYLFTVSSEKGSINFRVVRD